MPVKFAKKAVVPCCIMLINCALVFCFDLSIGLKASLGHFSFYGEDYERYKDRAGLQYVRSELKAQFAGGFFAVLGIIDPLAVQAEVFYTPRGGDAQKARYVLRSIHVHLLDIPILLKGRLAIGPGVFVFFAGSEFILPFSDGNVVTRTATIKERGDTLSFRSMNPFQVGIVFGLDYGIPFGPGKIYFDVRSFWCLTPFHPASHIEKNDVKESSVLLMIGYGLDLIKSQEEVPQ